MNVRQDEKKLSLQQVPWVAGRPDGYYFVANPLVVNAAPDVVWAVVTDVDKYQQYSGGALAVRLNQDSLKVDSTLHIALYPDDLFGKFIPESEERVSVVDSENHVLAWERTILFNAEPTECYRVLEPVEDGTRTKSHVVLKIPGWAGFFTNLFLKKRIEHAFDQVNAGVKDAAEHVVSPGC